jgi:nitronate monooxygenase
MNRNQFTTQVGVELPVVCGPMYPCSNPELVAAVSQWGGMGVIQPLSLVYVHGYEFREGLNLIKKLTQKPVGLNIITEKSSKIYQDRMKRWLDISLELGVRFFVTSLGNPSWVVERVKSVGGVVYHDVTRRKWAEKALEAGVHGLIAVNDRAGGHAGDLGLEKLWNELGHFGVPVLAAGGMSTPEQVVQTLKMGYQGVQLGTRFIATPECTAHMDYKNAILKATSKDIVLTEKISGVPVSVIQTEYIKRLGTKASPVARWALNHPKLKHYMRMVYTLQSLFKLKKSSTKGSRYLDYFQAGKSVDGIHSIESVETLMKAYQKAWEA